MASDYRPRVIGGWVLDDSLVDIHYVLCCRIVSVRDPKEDSICLIESEQKSCLAFLDISAEPRTSSIGNVWLHDVILSLFSRVDAPG